MESITSPSSRKLFIAALGLIILVVLLTIIIGNRYLATKALLPIASPVPSEITDSFGTLPESPSVEGISSCLDKYKECVDPCGSEDKSCAETCLTLHNECINQQAPDLAQVSSVDYQNFCLEQVGLTCLKDCAPNPEQVERALCEDQCQQFYENCQYEPLLEPIDPALLPSEE